jgi:pSer/pThr/pTyr-binding forkhead associated (FHA) protein
MREDRDATEWRTPSAGLPAPTGPAWLVEPDSGRRYDLTPSLTMIGRSAPSHIALGADPYLSRRHAAISVQDSAYWFLDLASATGSFFNQRPAVGPQRLSAGDTIHIGMTSLTFEVAPPEDIHG